VQKPTHAILGATFAVVLGVAWTHAPSWLRLIFGFLNPSVSLPAFLPSGALSSLYLLLQGALFGVLPDIDLLFRGVLDHRCGLTHSLVSIFIFFPLVAVLLRVSPLIGFFCTFSHWISDAVTFRGVRTWGFSPSFFLNHRCDYRLAKIRSDSKIANSLLSAFSLLVLGALF